MHLLTTLKLTLHLPRKGMETTLPVGYSRWNSSVDITSSPQGDGNVQQLTQCLTLSQQLTLHLPRKGMETTEDSKLCLAINDVDITSSPQGDGNALPYQRLSLGTPTC